VEVEVSTPFVVRLGAVAGGIGFIGITLGFIAIPMVLAGQPPTTATDLPTAMAYFRHPEFALINGLIGVFVGVVAILPFGIALRTVLRDATHERVRAFADIGLAILVVAAPVYVISGSLGAALVPAADGDAGLFGILFRWYEVLYNGAADVLEGAWIGAFSLAMLGSSLPQWLAWLGVVLGLSRWVKAFAPFTSIPAAVEPISNVLFLLWFAATVIVLSRIVLAPRRVAIAGPTAA
jgi:hypothetical protein